MCRALGSASPLGRPFEVDSYVSTVVLDAAAALSTHELPGPAVSEGVVPGVLSVAVCSGGSVEPAAEGEIGCIPVLGDLVDSVDVTMCSSRDL